MRAKTVAIAIATAWVALGCASRTTRPALDLWTEPGPNGREVASIRGLEAGRGVPRDPQRSLRLAPNDRGLALELRY
jgi:hypothetical protein